MAWKGFSEEGVAEVRGGLLDRCLSHSLGSGLIKLRSVIDKRERCSATGEREKEWRAEEMS